MPSEPDRPIYPDKEFIKPASRQEETTRECGRDRIDDIVDESIVRHFGLVIAGVDFSPAGPLKYVTPSVDGEHTDCGEFVTMSADLAQLIMEASGRRDRLTEERKKS